MLWALLSGWKIAGKGAWKPMDGAGRGPTGLPKKGFAGKIPVSA